MATGRALAGILVTLIVLGIIGALLPPFFTDGRCTAEFEAAGRQVESLRAELETPEKARGYLSAHGIAYQEVSAEQCVDSPPPGVEYCGGGPVILFREPTEDKVCRYYRDDSTHVELLYNRNQALVRVLTDMKPYKILSSRYLGLTFYWAR